MTDWWSEHPDLEGVARRGRSELTDDAAAAEADTELLRRRRRSLIDVCFEWMSRGDQVTVSAGGEHFDGRLTTVVHDLIVVETSTIVVGVNSCAIDLVRTVTRALYEGTSGRRDVNSFRAYLARFEVAGKVVRIVGRGFDITGRVVATTDDHVLVTDALGTESAIPWASVFYVVTSE